MKKVSTALLAGGALIWLAAPASAFQCPSDIAAIDAALESADLSEDQKQEVVELRDEGAELHEAGDHQAAVDTLAQAKEILGIK